VVYQFASSHHPSFCWNDALGENIRTETLPEYKMKTQHQPEPTKQALIAEFMIICIGFPFCMIYFRLAPFMFTFLWFAALLCVYSYSRTPLTKGAPIWRWQEINWRNLKPILLRFSACTALLAVLICIFMPERFLSLPKERPELWARIMLLYPLLSAVPQEFIFCTYFFARYKYLFKNERTLLLAAAVIFGCTHILYINWVAPILSLFGGYFFAQTYVKTRSLALVSLEHTLYGNMLFTIGLGLFFYGGNG